MTNCNTCANPIVPGAKFCPECGTPVASENTPIAAQRSKDILIKLLNEGFITGLIKPNAYGQPALETLLAAGDYAQAEADFETFFESRPPLTITVVFVTQDEAKETFQQFLGGCGQNVLGYVEFEGGMLYVSANYDRDLSLPNGLALFAKSLRGTVEVLLGEPTEVEKDHSNFMHKASEDILDIFQAAGLVSTPLATPERYDLKESIESSVFKFVPDENNDDDFLVGAIYLGVPAKGMFGFDERTNQARISDENWVIEISSGSMKPSLFSKLVAQYQAEVGGTVKSLT